MAGVEIVLKQRQQCLRGRKPKNKTLIPLVIMYFIASGFSFFEGMDDWFYIIQSQTEIFLMSSIAYYICPNDYKAKSVLMSVMLYNGYILSTDWAMLNVTPLQWFCEILLFSLLAIFQIIKNYDLQSDAFNHDNVFILFYRPKKAN